VDEKGSASEGGRPRSAGSVQGLGPFVAPWGPGAASSTVFIILQVLVGRENYSKSSHSYLLAEGRLLMLERLILRDFR